MNTTDSLSLARRALDKAQTVFQNTMLSNAVRGTASADEAKRDSTEWQNAYYSSSTLKSFTDRFSKFYAKEFHFAKYAEPAYLAVVRAWKAYDVARLAEKARLTAKRAVVAAKRDLKTELNLQEGVSLKGVDVGQYKVILAGLEPVRLHVYNVRKSALLEAGRTMELALASNGWNIAKTYPSYYNGKLQHGDERPDQFHLFFILGTFAREFAVRRPLHESNDMVEAEATQFALAYVQGYAAKLAVKTGEAIAYADVELTGFAPVSAAVTTNNLWSDSIASIILENKNGTSRTLRFHTQIIWNRSCLGKVFNQYPTRRVA